MITTGLSASHKSITTKQVSYLSAVWTGMSAKCTWSRCSPLRHRSIVVMTICT